MQRGERVIGAASGADEREDPMRVLDQLARLVVSKGFAAPALFLLELHRPLSVVLRCGMQVLVPIVAPLIGLAHARALNAALSRPESLVSLIGAIERHAAAVGGALDARP